MCETLNCSPLSAMKMKSVSEKTKSKCRHYSKTDTKKALRELLLNTENQLAVCAQEKNSRSKCTGTATETGVEKGSCSALPITNFTNFDKT